MLNYAFTWLKLIEIILSGHFSKKIIPPNVITLGEIWKKKCSIFIENLKNPVFLWLYHIISYHIVSYRIVSYRIVSYHIISYHIMSCHIISYHIISYHIISYQSLFPYQNKHKNQKVTIKNMYSKKQNGNGGEGRKAKKAWKYTPIQS